jgi:hypothetical protein
MGLKVSVYLLTTTRKLQEIKWLLLPSKLKLPTVPWILLYLLKQAGFTIATLELVIFMMFSFVITILYYYISGHECLLEPSVLRSHPTHDHQADSVHQRQTGRVTHTELAAILILMTVVVQATQSSCTSTAYILTTQSLSPIRCCALYLFLADVITFPCCYHCRSWTRSGRWSGWLSRLAGRWFSRTSWAVRPSTPWTDTRDRPCGRGSE